MNDLENAQEALKVFGKAIREMLDVLQERMKVIYEAIEEALEASRVEKTTFKPIPSLLPHQTLIMDKKQFATEKYNQAEKTTHVVHGNTIIHSVKLTSGDVIVEHCICMDPNDFDIDKGLSLCKEKVIKRLMKMHEPVSSMAKGGLIPTSAIGGHISAPAIRGDMSREAITINMSRPHSMNEILEELSNQLNRSQRMMR